MKKARLIFGTMFMTLLVMTQVVSAQVIWWEDPQLEIDYQYVDVTIQDQVATTHIDMQFSNLGDWRIEGTYLFPLPDGALVSELIMYVDGVPYEAQVLDADEAREIYDEFVNQGVDPALVEYVDTNVIQASVFPIDPQDSRRIEIEYQQILTAEDGVIQYQFLQNELYANKSLNVQRITVNVTSNEEIRTIYSSSHNVDTQQADNFSAVVSYEAENVVPDTTFDLLYTVSADEIGLNLLSYQPDDENGYFLLLAAPGIDVSEEEIIPKDVILVFDRSGSMGSDNKIEQARAALLDVVGRLNPEDRFNIVTFSSGVESFSPELLPADDTGNYVDYVNAIDASGGTNISEALNTALQQVDPDRLTTILFLTDGQATSGITDANGIISLINPLMTDNVRLFAFGVGNAKIPFLETITSRYRGQTTHIQSEDQVESAVADFYTTISKPLLTDVTVDYGVAPVYSVLPSGPVDLFVGSQLVIAGRYLPFNSGVVTETAMSTITQVVTNTITRTIVTETPTGTITTTETVPITSTDTITQMVIISTALPADSFPITLTGQFNGITQTFAYTGNVLAASGGYEPITLEWANRMIEDLWDQVVALGGNCNSALPEIEELVESMKTLSVQYEIVSECTSFFVPEPETALAPDPQPDPADQAFGQDTLTVGAGSVPPPQPTATWQPQPTQAFSSTPAPAPAVSVPLSVGMSSTQASGMGYLLVWVALTFVAIAGVLMIVRTVKQE